MSHHNPSLRALARFEFTAQQIEYARQCLHEEDDWSAWLNNVEANGLSGVVNAHLADLELTVPGNIKLSLRALNIRHKAAAHARIEALRLIADSFERASVDYVALKGVALLPRLYKQAEMRPMRDMDLLVPIAQQQVAGDCLREVGFDLPHEQPSKFMRYVHQLPNATLNINGFTCSVEVHNNAFSSDVGGKLRYPVSAAQRQTLNWHGLAFGSLDDITMLHQVCRHLEGLHPGGVLKLINVMDVIGLASDVERNADWAKVSNMYPHVLVTLKCLHLITPLPENLAKRLPMPDDLSIDGVGQIMESLTEVLTGQRKLTQRLTMLFSPSDWWLHLHYNVDPEHSILWVKIVRHPWRVAISFGQRAWSAILGG